MSDDWEDWENQEYIIPVLSVQNSEQLEERRLVEESDNSLTRALFSGEDDDLLGKEFVKNELQISNKKISSTNIKAPKKQVASKQKENELKQKELSKKNKEEKLKKLKEKEIFGEAEEDVEYSKHEDMFY